MSVSLFAMAVYLVHNHGRVCDMMMYIDLCLCVGCVSDLFFFLAYCVSKFGCLADAIHVITQFTFTFRLLKVFCYSNCAVSVR